MTLAIKIGLFGALFWFMYLLLTPRDKFDITPMGLTTDFIKRKLENFYTSGERAEKLTIISRSPTEAIKYAVIVGLSLGVIGWSLSYIMLKRIDVVAPGFMATLIAAGVFLIGLFTVRTLLELEFKQWQSELILGLSAFFNFMSSFLEVGVLTVNECLARTVPFLPEPLRSEMQVVVDKFNRDGNAMEALERFAEKAKHPLIDATCYRLRVAWDSRVEPNMFEDLAEAMENEREKVLATATLLKKVQAMAIMGIALIGALPVWGYPIGKLLLKKITEGLGM